MGRANGIGPNRRRSPTAEGPEVHDEAEVHGHDEVHVEEARASRTGTAVPTAGGGLDER